MFWEYDGRIGRRWNVDPVVKTNLSSYCTFSNNPILRIDPFGDDDYFSNTGKYLRSDDKNTNTIMVDVNGKFYPLANLKIPYKKSLGHIGQSSLLAIMNHYSKGVNATGVEEGVNVMHNVGKNRINIFLKWDFKNKGYKINPLIGDGKNVENTFEHEGKHNKDKRMDLGKIDSEMRAVITQISSDSWSQTTTEYKEQLFNWYAGYVLTKAGAIYKTEFEKKAGIVISKKGDYAKWEYKKKK